MPEGHNLATAGAASSGRLQGFVPGGVWNACRKGWMSAECVPGLVSVIIPTHNSARFLVDALASVLAQDYRPVEIIVVDDGSTDNTAEVLEEWGRNVRGDGTVCLHSFRQGQKGAPAARNKGLMESHGEYIQFLDADDILSSGKIALQVSVLSASGPGKAVAYGPWRYFAKAGDRIGMYEAHHEAHGGEWLKEWLSGWFSPNHSLLWRRSDVWELGPWDESLAADNDGEYAMRYLACGGGLVFCPNAWVYYRKNPNFVLSATGISGRCSGSSIRSRIRVVRRMERFLAKAVLLDEGYRNALSRRYYDIAKLCTTGNRCLRKVCLREFRRLSCDGRAPGTFRHRALTRLFGFALTQKFRVLLLGGLRIPTYLPVAKVRTMEELCVVDRSVA